MSRDRYEPEQIINLLRESEVSLPQGQNVGEVCRSLGISEQSYYRWRSEYGGMKLAQVKRLKELRRKMPSSRRQWLTGCDLGYLDRSSDDIGGALLVFSASRHDATKVFS